MVDLGLIFCRHPNSISNGAEQVAVDKMTYRFVNSAWSIVDIDTIHYSLFTFNLTLVLS